MDWKGSERKIGESLATTFEQFAKKILKLKNSLIFTHKVPSRDQMRYEIELRII